MKELVKLCEAWIDENAIITKQIKIEDSTYNIYLSHKKGMSIEFSVYISAKTEDDTKKEFLTLINNLIKYNVEDNLPF